MITPPALIGWCALAVAWMTAATVCLYPGLKEKVDEKRYIHRAEKLHTPVDPPPLKWSALRYAFRAKEDHDAEEETQARGDCWEAAPGGCAGVAGAERCRSGTLDWGYGGHVLPLAPGVWRAQERSGQATEGSRD